MPLRSRVPQFCYAPRCRCTVSESQRIYSLTDPNLYNFLYSIQASSPPGSHIICIFRMHHLHLYSIEWKDSFGAISLGSRLVEFRTMDTEHCGTHLQYLVADKQTQTRRPVQIRFQIAGLLRVLCTLRATRRGGLVPFFL